MLNFLTLVMAGAAPCMFNRPMLNTESLQTFEQLYEQWRCAEEAACHAEEHTWAKFRACCRGAGTAPSEDEVSQAARLRREASQRLMVAMSEVWSKPL